MRNFVKVLLLGTILVSTSNVWAITREEAIAIGAMRNPAYAQYLKNSPKSSASTGAGKTATTQPMYSLDVAASTVRTLHPGAKDIKFDSKNGRYTATVNGRQVSGDYNPATNQVNMGAYTGVYAQRAGSGSAVTSAGERTEVHPNIAGGTDTFIINEDGVPTQVTVRDKDGNITGTYGNAGNDSLVRRLNAGRALTAARNAVGAESPAPGTTPAATPNAKDIDIVRNTSLPMSEREAAAARLNSEIGYYNLPDDVQRIYNAKSNETLQENIRKALDPNLSAEEREMAAHQVNNELGYYNMPEDVKKVYDGKIEAPKTEAPKEKGPGFWDNVRSWAKQNLDSFKNKISTTDPNTGVISSERGKALGLDALFNLDRTPTKDGGSVFTLSGEDNDKLGKVFGINIDKNGNITKLGSNSDADNKVADAVINLDKSAQISKADGALISATKDHVNALNEELTGLREQLKGASGAEKSALKEQIKEREAELKEANSKLLKQQTDALKNASQRVTDATALQGAVADRTAQHLAAAGIGKDSALGSALLSGKTTSDEFRSAIADAANKVQPEFHPDTTSNESLVRDLKFGAGVADAQMKGALRDAGVAEVFKPDGSYDYDAMRAGAKGNDDLMGKIDQSEKMNDLLNQANYLNNNEEQCKNDGAAMSAANGALEDANKDLATQQGDSVPQIPQTLKVWDVVQTALEILANEKSDNKVNENKEVIVQAGDIGEAVAAEDATELADIDMAQLGKTAAGAAALTQQLLQAAQIDLDLLSTTVKKTETEEKKKEDPLYATFEAGMTTSGLGYNNTNDDENTEDSDTDDDGGDELTPEQAGYIQEIQSRRQKLLAQYANAGVLISEGMNAISNAFMDRAKALVDFANAQNPPTETGSFGLVQDVGRYVLLETLRGAALSAVQMGVQGASLLNAQDVTPPSAGSTDGDNNGEGDNK